MAYVATPKHLQDDRRRTGQSRDAADLRHTVLHLPEALPVTEAEIDLVLGTLGATIAAILGGDE